QVCHDQHVKRACFVGRAKPDQGLRKSAAKLDLTRCPLRRGDAALYDARLTVERPAELGGDAQPRGRITREQLVRDLDRALFLVVEESVEDLRLFVGP